MKSNRSIYFMIALLFGLFLVEITSAYITGSNSLMAESFHMLNDLLSLLISLVAIKLGSRPASPRNTFGWSRAEILASLINSVFLLSLCISIIIESVQKFIFPEPIKNAPLLIAIGALSLVMNTIGLFMFGSHGHQHTHEPTVREWNLATSTSTSPATSDNISKNNHHHNHHHSHSENMNMHAIFLHILGDALCALTVLISGLVIMFVPPFDDDTQKKSNEVKWKLYVDPVLSIFLSILISISTLKLIKASSRILLQSTPDHVSSDNLEKEILAIEGVRQVHELKIWRLNSQQNVASVHVTVWNDAGIKLLDQVLSNVYSVLRSNNIHFITVQLESPLLCSCSCSLSCECVKLKNGTEPNLAE